MASAAEPASRSKSQPSRDILTLTIRNPPFSYAHLELLTDPPSDLDPSHQTSIPSDLDDLQVKSFCTSALRQFLGLTGAAIPLDILKVHGRECWIRMPRQDLPSFAAAITSWKGTREGNVMFLLRLRRCSDWLGTMLGSDG